MEMKKESYETIGDRIEITFANIEFQQGYAMWDDIEKLENVVQQLKDGKRLSDPFEFVLGPHKT